MATADVRRLGDAPGDVGGVVGGQRAQHAAVGLDPLGDLERQLRVDRRRRRGEEEVVPVVLDPGFAAQAQEVGEALGDDERERAALLLEDHVGGERRAVHDPRHVAGRDADAPLSTCRTPSITPTRGSSGVVGHLVDVEVAVGVGEHDVGERAADVDADEPARVAHSSLIRRTRTRR